MSLSASAQSSDAQLSSDSAASAGDHRIKEVMVDSRISKVLAMRTDSVAMLEALDAISEFYVNSEWCRDTSLLPLSHNSKLII